MFVIHFKCVYLCFSYHQGTGKIVALRLMGLSKMQHLGSEEFSKLPNLRFLELEGGNLVGDFKNLLSELTWLSWKNCPSKLYATNLCLEKLAVLELLDTSINEDWAGWGPCLVSENLKVIHIAFCPNLMRIPDLSKCKNLERMVLHCCTTSLVIDGSISTLEQLQHLHIDGFFRGPDNGNLLAVPSALGGLRSLSRLELERMHVGELHYSVGEMTLLKYLSLQVCSLGKLPDSFGKLKSLLELNLALTGIRELPHSIGDLKMLTKMNLFMTPIKKLPDSIGGLESLIELRLVGTHITELPACIGDLKRLEILDASESNIRVLPKAIGMLENLKALKVSSRRNQGYVTFPPTDLATLSQLQVLEIYVDPRSLIGLPSSLEDLTLHNLNLPMERLPFSNLTNLARLSLENCCLREVEFEHVLGQQPEKLRILEVSSRDSLERLSVSTLKGLQMLTVFGCPGLMEIQGVEKLESLVSLRVGEGSRLRRLPDLSELKKLQNLDLGQCPLLDLPALRLPDMCYLHIYGCGNSSRFHGKYKDWKDSQYRKNHLIFSCGWYSAAVLGIKQE
ncbi:plant intracellular Ras-group-related LRR protein 4-like [Rhodamnia argentea]|uniref:Plant intracellular Ras-group-related LRR protein 4-like n=1 Tax=Rhodamnia argentea TaxID=178133 RepID=A0ABM3GZB5_9MYRT|nr:plant intracellular Ras-group-related LRR protein 4-like [Rhodamnia argentea]